MKARLWTLALLLAVIAILAVGSVAFADETHEGEVEFHGIVTSLPASGLVGDWQVNGVTVKVTEATAIDQEHGAVAVGALVEVKGTRNADRTVTATRIQVEGMPPIGGRNEIIGLVRSLPAGTLIGDWTVNMITVHVGEQTQIKQERGRVVVGALVKVKGERQSDGSLNASEIEVMLSPARGSLVKFYGVVQSLPAEKTGANLIGDWTVSERVVHVTAETEIDQEHGAVAVGALVEVSGVRLADGSVDARKIEVKLPRPPAERPIIFPGVVDSLPASGLIGEWQVSGRKVQVTAETEINQEHGAVAVGAFVEVKGTLTTDGKVLAREIQVKGRPPVGGGVFVKFTGTVATKTDVEGGYDLTVNVDADVRLVHVTRRTRVDDEHGAVAVDARVEVKGVRQADASIDAISIEVKAPEATQEPTLAPVKKPAVKPITP